MPSDFGSSRSSSSRHGDSSRRPELSAAALSRHNSSSHGSSRAESSRAASSRHDSPSYASSRAESLRAPSSRHDSSSLALGRPQSSRAGSSRYGSSADDLSLQVLSIHETTIKGKTQTPTETKTWEIRETIKPLDHSDPRRQQLLSGHRSSPLALEDSNDFGSVRGLLEPNYVVVEPRSESSRGHSSDYGSSRSGASRHTNLHSNSMRKDLLKSRLSENRPRDDNDSTIRGPAIPFPITDHVSSRSGSSSTHGSSKRPLLLENGPAESRSGSSRYSESHSGSSRHGSSHHGSSRHGSSSSRYEPSRHGKSRRDDDSY